MPIFNRLKQLLLTHFVSLSWPSLVVLLLGYGLSSWGLLYLCGEQALVAQDNFIYWLMVTASTVGYGDFSPQTTVGKWVVALWVIPVGLSLFALLVGRIATWVAWQWRKGVQGFKQMNYQQHTLVIGWNGDRTRQLLKLLLSEQQALGKQPIVLCVRAEIENPMPEAISFVRVQGFSHEQDMARTALGQARCIIIDNPDDELTMTTALYCASKNPQAHIIAYFKQEGLAELLRSHCPNVECMPSLSTEMMAKSAVDPGSSALHHQLLNVQQGMTQYAITYQGLQPLAVKQLLWGLKQQFDATLIGVTLAGESQMQLNPALSCLVTPGSRLYYIADTRITQIAWEVFDAEVV